MVTLNVIGANAKLKFFPIHFVPQEDLIPEFRRVSKILTQLTRETSKLSAYKGRCRGEPKDIHSCPAGLPSQ